jgi:uncharacterized membrane protein YbaN (DUF454 family)
LETGGEIGKTTVKKAMLIAAGFISLSLGVVGIFVPLLPTTPFLLLASVCFVRSSEKLHNWLIYHKVFGNYIRCYQQFRAISLRVKILTVTVLWVFIGYAVIFVVSAIQIRFLLLLTAVAVTIHILRLRTLTNEMPADLWFPQRREPLRRG